MSNSPLAAVIGDPVTHSISPKIFEFLSVKLGFPINYQKVNLTTKQLPNGLYTLSQLNFLGCNVTIPHKEKVIPLLNRLEGHAQKIGAVNVIKNQRGKLSGFNTDFMGVLETFNEHNISIKKTKVVVFGAGGASRAVLYTMAKEKALQVVIANRSPSKARKLAKTFQDIFPKTHFSGVALEHEKTQGADIYINSTPLGLKGFPNVNLLKGISGSNTVAAFDVVYSKSTTPFLKNAQSKSWKTLEGIDMLIWQALATWEIWIGKIPNKKEVKSELKSYLKGS